jgi:hypothetical protein
MLNESTERVSMRLLAFSLLPSHFHLVYFPRGETEPTGSATPLPLLK